MRMFDYQDIDGTDSPFLLDFPVAAPSGINSGAQIKGYFHAKSYTQEFRLTSPDDTRLKYVTGLWYARNDLDRYLGRGPVLQQASYLAQSTNENYSWYANTTYDVTAQFSLIAGLRFNKQKIDYDFDNYNVHPNAHFDGANQENALTGKGGLQYKWTPGPPQNPGCGARWSREGDESIPAERVIRVYGGDCRVVSEWTVLQRPDARAGVLCRCDQQQSAGSAWQAAQQCA
jgi:outer membrane receptor protein involved in Fe transport